MKRLIPRILILIITSSEILTSCSPAKKDEKKSTEIANTQVNELPNMVLHMLEGTSLSAKTLLGKKNVLILFQPDCDHCQNEAHQIKKNITAFRGYEIYFITIAKIEEVKKFLNDFKLNDQNIHFATTDLQSIINSYGQILAPSIYIYSEQGKLLTHFNGQTEIENVLKSL